MKNIAIDARPLSSKLTGIGRYLHNTLCSILKQDRVNQYFLYSSQDIEFDFTEYTNVHTRALTVNNKISELFLSQIVFSVWAQLDKIDTFWSPRHHLPLLLYFSNSIEKVVTVHDIVWLKYPETMSYGGLLLEKLLFKPSMKIASQIIVLSRFTQKEMIEELKIPKEKISVTGVGCFNPIGQSTKSELHIKSKYMLFVGTLEPRKNLYNILTAFKKISEFQKDLDLVIVGKNGWGNIRINDFVTNLNIEDKVKQVGYVNDETLAYLYEHCEVLLMPSIYEGFGFPALEALNYKKKVVVTKHSAISEIKGDNIFIAEIDSQSIFSKIKKALTTKTNNLAIIEPSWEPSAQKTLSILVYGSERKPGSTQRFNSSSPLVQ